MYKHKTILKNKKLSLFRFILGLKELSKLYEEVFIFPPWWVVIFPLTIGILILMFFNGINYLIKRLFNAKRRMVRDSEMS